jgi:hypothetical protein
LLIIDCLIKNTSTKIKKPPEIGVFRRFFGMDKIVFGKILLNHQFFDFNKIAAFDFYDVNSFGRLRKIELRFG